jgi:hypothetical protein
MNLRPEAAALVHLIEPWATDLPDVTVHRLSSNHGRADVLFEVAMYISNNTDVSLKDIAADDLESAARRLIQGRLIGLTPPSKLKENSDDKRSTMPSTGSVLRSEE